MKIRLLDPIIAVLVVALGAAMAVAQDESADTSAASAERSAQSAGTGTRNDERPPIYPWLAAGLIERGVPVIDVRSDEEVEATGLLGDAEHIAHTEIEAIAEFIGEPPGRTVVIYCGSGRRAGRVIEALTGRGYQGLVNAGGYEDLEAALEERR